MNVPAKYTRGSRGNLTLLAQDWSNHLAASAASRRADISDCWWDLCVQAFHAEVCAHRTQGVRHLYQPPRADDTRAACEPRRKPDQFGVDQWDLSSLYAMSVDFITTYLIPQRQIDHIVHNCTDDNHALNTVRQQARRYLWKITAESEPGKITARLLYRYQQQGHLHPGAALGALISVDGRLPDEENPQQCVDFRRDSIFTIMATWPTNGVEALKTYSKAALDAGAKQLIDRVVRFFEYDILDSIIELFDRRAFPSLIEDMDQIYDSGDSNEDGTGALDQTGFSRRFTPGMEILSIADQRTAQVVALEVWCSWDADDRCTWQLRNVEGTPTYEINGKTIGAAGRRARMRALITRIAEAASGHDVLSDDVNAFIIEVADQLDLLGSETR